MRCLIVQPGNAADAWGVHLLMTAPSQISAWSITPVTQVLPLHLL